MIMFIFHALKIFLFAAFFFNLGLEKAGNPSYTWSETAQSSLQKVFKICDGFDFCKNLNETAVEPEKVEK